MSEKTWNYLQNLSPISEIPILWDASGYTTESFNHEVQAESFTGWDGDLVDEEEVAVMARLLDVHPGQSLLDVACGYGRHALLFALNHAMQVTGVDISRGLIARARKLAAGQGVNATFTTGHGRDLRWRETFDRAIVAYNSFSIFGPDDAPVVLRGIHAALKPGGRLFLDLDNKPHHVRYGTCYRNWHVGETALTLQDVHFHYDLSVEVLRDVIVHAGFHRLDEFICFKRLYERGEIEGLLTGNGFRVETVYGNWDLTPFSESSPKIIAVASKQQR